MASFNDLGQGSYYVIQEVENAPLELIYVPLITQKCVLIEYQDEDQSLSWYRKTDPIFEIVEELSDDHAVVYESLFESKDDEDDFFWGEEEEEDEDDGDFWGEDDATRN